MIILYAAVEFVLYADARCMYPLYGLPDYHTCVQTMEKAGQVPNEVLLEAHRNLTMVVTERFWATITELAQKHQQIMPSVASMISRPRYIARLSNANSITVDGPTQSNPYCVRPVPVADVPACYATGAIPSHELFFKNYAQESTSLAGVVTLPDGKTAWFKPAEESKTEHFLTELEIYQRITAKCDGASMSPRMPTLHALAMNHDGQGVLGILVTSIEGRMLSDCSQTERWLHRTQWQQQLNESLRFLHSHGVIWGDANETNVIIDRHDEAWVIDFEGGQIGADSIVLDLKKMEKDLEDVKAMLTRDGI
jgi:hypothetical protein